MRKSLAVLLCVGIVLSLCACGLITVPLGLGNESDTAEGEEPASESESTTEELPTETIESTKYYKIEKLRLTTVRYTVYDSNGSVVLREETDRPLKISMLNESVLDIRIGMGSGIVVHKYYDTQNNRFSEEYDSVAATSGNLVAYIDCSMEDPMKNRRLVIRDIFDKNAFYKTFKPSFAPDNPTPVLSAEFTEGEAGLEITYYAEWDWMPVTTLLSVRSQVGVLRSEEELALCAFGEVLKNDIPVYEVNGDSIGEPCSLRDVKTPTDRIPLCEVEGLRYAYLDIDGDMKQEMIIDCDDMLVLRFYENNVYVYPFSHKQMYDLQTDGSYAWNRNGQSFEYGESRLAFDGAALRSVELWRIVNDREPDAEYYIGGERVTKEEILTYFARNPKARVELLPLETAWENEISSDAAREIAERYVRESCGDEIGYQLILVSKWDLDYSVYVFLVRPTPVEISREVWIDKYTGEVIPPDAIG